MFTRKAKISCFERKSPILGSAFAKVLFDFLAKISGWRLSNRVACKKMCTRIVWCLRSYIIHTWRRHLQNVLTIDTWSLTTKRSWCNSIKELKHTFHDMMIEFCTPTPLLWMKAVSPQLREITLLSCRQKFHRDFFRLLDICFDRESWYFTFKWY